MGMMDGGLNFQDTCHKCECSKHGGTMRRYKADRNIKLCDTCYKEHDNKTEYLYARELKNV